MTPPWNGLPDQPERKRWHWVASKLKPNGWLLQKWVPECRKWNGLFGTDPVIAANIWVYGCPALNPSELAQMRKDERERCAELCDNYGYSPAFYAAEAIRALTDDEGKKS
ncbi:hypothetical protein K6L44_06675 [Gluconacetobacter entanii]|uniref:hypothetical protein n=1 Tax=Gluconacetobacter entanii TaxID=108528 RepID=UPI001C934E7F|nr:hypothetical protein [Gluconacetobacter entanii]MBY4639686.1 hypothetical protein [Gluconacetobacter entanii]MCW4579188.1 hypothetical protein [Gluconacetobacter entanii]MCW4582578.1 hypothetical protein [Gluconacetobacter entanii]MCW4585973.1 hypothetical protein [Gluconacetobacter entanii]